MAEETAKNKSGKGKFFLGAAIGAAIGAVAGHFMAKNAQSEDECDCGEDCECENCDREEEKPAKNVKTEQKKPAKSEKKE